MILQATLKMEAAAKRLQPMALPAPVAFIPYTYGPQGVTDAAWEKETPDTDEELDLQD